MARQKNIWKFNDDEWKVHISDASLLEQVKIKFDLGKSQTIYYGKGSFKEETAWDLIVPDKKINKVKKFIKDNS